MSILLLRGDINFNHPIQVLFCFSYIDTPFFLETYEESVEEILQDHADIPLLIKISTLGFSIDVSCLN